MLSFRYFIIEQDVTATQYWITWTTACVQNVWQIIYQLQVSYIKAFKLILHSYSNNLFIRLICRHKWLIRNLLCITNKCQLLIRFTNNFMERVATLIKCLIGKLIGCVLPSKLIAWLDDDLVLILRSFANSSFVWIDLNP